MLQFAIYLLDALIVVAAVLSAWFWLRASGKRVQATMANVERRGERPTWGDRVYVSWEASSPILLWN